MKADIKAENKAYCRSMMKIIKNGSKIAGSIEKTADRIKRIETFKELLFYASPAAVIIYCIVRLIIWINP